jgi:hypothetical protein
MLIYGHGITRRIVGVSDPETLARLELLPPPYAHVVAGGFHHSQQAMIFELTGYFSMMGAACGRKNSPPAE